MILLKKRGIFMKNQKKVKKPWLISIIVSIILFILPSVILFGTFFLLSIEDNFDKDYYYDDGTVVHMKSGPLYDHILFDNYSVSFEGEAQSEIRKIADIETYNEYYDSGEINKFTFDKNGYIAYHIADDNTNEYRLFTVKDKSIKTFATMKDLYDYCNENNINLGLWYHGLHLEQLHFDKKGWTLTINSADVSFLRHNGEELFSGQIDKYFYTNRYLFFQFQHFDISRYNEEPNPVIPVDESVVIRKRINRRFFPFRDEVHAEKYVCIDTETDKYVLFDDKESIEEYARSLETKPEWEKIKFDKKINN